jgi:hypothetical protein
MPRLINQITNNPKNRFLNNGLPNIENKMVGWINFCAFIHFTKLFIYIFPPIKFGGSGYWRVGLINQQELNFN